jgi:transposase
MRTSQKTPETITTIGIDLGKNTFHLVGLDKRGAIVLQQKVSRGQLGRRLSNIPRCLIGMEACSGSHHIGRQLAALGHDVRLIPAQYVKPFLKGHKNDYRDAEAIAEAVQRPTMHFVAIKTPEQMDLLALHRVRSRLVGIQGWINYYGNFYRTQLRSTLKSIDLYVIRWARRKFKRLRRKTKGARDWFDRLRRANPTLFAHWQLCHGCGRTSGAV